MQDFSGSAWVTFFGEQAEKLLGMKASRMKQLKDEDVGIMMCVVIRVSVFRSSTR